MSKHTKLQPVLIKILGKDYKIACSEDEQESLLRSAQALDDQMRTIRDSGKVSGADRIAVMAALNLTHELRHSSNKGTEPKENISSHLANLRHKIENVLENL
ncbi:MAG: cell division protein ZapA [Methylococcales bacterium]|nr:cell division protein ZapA [Methylococcales bacterium]